SSMMATRGAASGEAAASDLSVNAPATASTNARLSAARMVPFALIISPPTSGSARQEPAPSAQLMSELWEQCKMNHAQAVGLRMRRDPRKYKSAAGEHSKMLIRSAFKAVPSTTDTVLQAAHRDVGEARLAHIFRFVDVARVDQIQPFHHRLQAAEIEAAKLVPF